MRKPIENGFGSMATPWSSSVRKVSRALWPTASTTWSVRISSPLASRTPRSRPSLEQETFDAALESDLAAEAFDLRAQVLDHLDQLERPDVRPVDPEDLLRRAGRHEVGQDLAAEMAGIAHLAVELAVGEGPGAAFAELHVRLRVEDPLAPEAEGVDGALADLLAALENDRAEAHLGESQRGKEAARPGADDHRPRSGEAGRRLGDEAIGGVRSRQNVPVVGEAPQELRLAGARSERDIEGVDQADRLPLAGVDAALEDGERQGSPGGARAAAGARPRGRRPKRRAPGRGRSSGSSESSNHFGARCWRARAPRGRARERSANRARNPNARKPCRVPS